MSDFPDEAVNDGVVDVTVLEAEDGARADVVVRRALPNFSRAAIRDLFARGAVSMARGERWPRIRKGHPVSAQASVRINVSALDAAAQPDPDLSLHVLHEDQHFVAINKPTGVPCAPRLPGELGSIANALVARYPEMAEVGFSAREPGLCHRLDVATSGVLLAARSKEAFDMARGVMADQTFLKRYVLVCGSGLVEETEGKLTTGLAADYRHSKRVMTLRAGRRRTTQYKLRATESEWACFDAEIGQGYRHQIRAHFRELGAPIAGDSLYGGPEVTGLDRVALHSAELRGALGDFGEIAVKAPWPDDLAAVWPTFATVV